LLSRSSSSLLWNSFCKLHHIQKHKYLPWRTWGVMSASHIIPLSLYLCRHFSCFSYKNDALQKSSRKATSSSSFYFTLLSLFPKP
jgi:hypothetical protein